MKKILFVCIENACRSQMAEGFARVLGAGVLEASSAGSGPSGEVNPRAVEVMAQTGIDISANRSKGFSDLADKRFDYVVTLGCDDRCPTVAEGRHIDWHIEDPRGRDIEFFRKVRDVIRGKVAALVHEISGACRQENRG